MKRLSYYPARSAVIITGIVFISQIMVEMGAPVCAQDQQLKGETNGCLCRFANPL